MQRCDRDNAVDPISLEDLALLEVLQRIDQAIPLESGDTEIRQRMVETGLVTEDGEGSQLTAAGVELCKSLQHRVAADKQAARIIEQRKAEAGDGADTAHLDPASATADRASATPG